MYVRVLAKKNKIYTIKNIDFYSMNFIYKQTFQKPECVLTTSSTHLITQVVTQPSPNCIIQKNLLAVTNYLENLDMSTWYKKYLWL